VRGGKLESGETERCAACGIGLRQEVEDRVGAVVDEVESVESEGRPGAIPKEPLEAGAVGGLDADAPIEAKTASVIPAEHVVGLVGLQEAVACEPSGHADEGAERSHKVSRETIEQSEAEFDELAEHSPSDGVLEALQELVGEGGGFVEAEAGFWMGRILMGVILDSLEQPVHDAHVEMVVRVQRRAEAMQEAHRARGGGGWGG
jgi:hypothetical protein